MVETIIGSCSDVIIIEAFTVKIIVAEFLVLDVVSITHKSDQNASLIVVIFRRKLLFFKKVQIMVVCLSDNIISISFLVKNRNRRVN